MESPHASSLDFQVGENTRRSEPSRPSSGQLPQQPAGRWAEEGSFVNILVVNDNPDICNSIKVICESSGYEVQEAEDRLEAINVLRSAEENFMSIDAIIADISMPKITGLEAIAYFQKEFPNIPLIVLTEISDLELAISFTDRGISNYLVKPIEPEHLKASVAGAVRHRQLTCV